MESSAVSPSRDTALDNVRYLRLTAVLSHTAGTTVASLPSAIFKIPDPYRHIMDTLQTFDGLRSTADIEESLSPSHPFIALMPDFIEGGILTPTHQLSLHSHDYGNNPMTFASATSASEVIHLSHASSSALPNEPYKSIANDQLEQLMESRCSCRSFAPQPLNPQEVYSVMYGSVASSLRSAPSPGSLYPVNFHVLITRGSHAGVYRWNRPTNFLEFIAPPPEAPALKFCLDSESCISNAPAILLVSIDFTAVLAKYSNRGYRFAVLEAGHLAQSFMLRAEANGMATLEWGAYLDGATAQAFSTDPRVYTPITIVALGYPHESSNDDDRLDKIHQKLFVEVESSEVIHWVTRRRPILPSGATSLLVFSHLRFVKPNGLIGYASGVARTTKTADVKAMAEAFERSAAMRWDADVLTVLSDDMTRFWSPRLPDGSRMTRDALESLGAIGWKRGRALNGAEHWIPSECIFIGTPTDHSLADVIDRPNSSGMAAHSDLEVAEFAALCELIERDAFARAWYHSDTQVNAVDMKCWPRWFQRETENWAEFTDHVHVIVIAGYLPTVVVAVSSSGRPSLSVGASCGEDAEAALEKAWMEAAAGNIVNRVTASTVTSPNDVLEPNEHALYYREPSHAESIRSFFDRPVMVFDFHQRFDLDATRNDINPIFVDMNSNVLGLHVVRAFSEVLFPLRFGRQSIFYAAAESMPPWRPDINPHPFP